MGNSRNRRRKNNAQDNKPEIVVEEEIETNEEIVELQEEVEQFGEEETSQDTVGEITPEETEKEVVVDPVEEAIVNTIEEPVIEEEKKIKEPIVKEPAVEISTPMGVLMDTYVTAVNSGVNGAIGAGRQFGLIEGINNNFGDKIQASDLLAEFSKHAKDIFAPENICRYEIYWSRGQDSLLAYNALFHMLSMIDSGESDIIDKTNFIAQFKGKYVDLGSSLYRAFLSNK